MNGFYSLLIAVSMYSKVPVPSVNWTRERMGYVMCWFPIVGIFCGIALFIWIEVGNLFHLSPEMTGIVAAVVPLLVTGGIHMDGFLDTCDALSSYGEREKKLEILKDPHVGAFGVIACGLYLLICAGVMCELAERAFLLLAVPAFVMERAFSGLSVVFFPCAKNSGLAATFSDGAKRKAAAVCLSLWLIASFLLAFWMSRETGRGLVFAAGLLAVQGAVFFWYRYKSRKEFGGITGDLAGWFLQLCEGASLWWILAFSCFAA